MRIPFLVVVTALAVQASSTGFAQQPRSLTSRISNGEKAAFENMAATSSPVPSFLTEPASLFAGWTDVPAPRLSIPSMFSPQQLSEPVVFRGQSPPQTFETPPIQPPSYDPSMPYSGGAPRDPFLYGDPVLGAPQGSTIISGVNGPQPYRFGFTPKMDYTYIAPAGAQSPGNGRFSSNDFNFELAHVSQVGPGWILTNTPQAGIRLWDGPGTPALPGSVYRFGWDFTLATPIVGLWSMQLDFNPSINTDFDESLARQALNLDGNAMLFYRMSPQLMLVLGAGYWDRVDKIVLPYAGVVWNPNDLWEFRLLFPKARISYFLGNINHGAHWVYATGEYHVDSYQINQPGVSNQQVQIQDWRFGLGLRSDHQTYDKFIEVGVVFGRNVEFLNTTPGFGLNEALMLRAGVKF